MIKPTPSELFSQPPVRSDFSRSRLSGGKRRWVVIVLPVLLFVGLVVAYFQFSEEPDVSGDIPTVTADVGSKERPEQPGGVDIPHQDMLVFQQLEKGTNEASSQVEHLLPPPEAPQPENTVPTTVMPQDQGAASTVVGEQQNAVPVAEQASQPVAEVKAESSPVSAPQPTTVAVPAAPVVTTVKKVEETKPTSVPQQTEVGKLPKEMFVSKPSAVSKGSAVLQLASITDSKVAQSEAKRLQAKYLSQLGGAQLRVVKADLGAKGIYYRIQSEGISEADAKNICAALKAQHAGCIIVRQ